MSCPDFEPGIPRIPKPVWLSPRKKNWRQNCSSKIIPRKKLEGNTQVYLLESYRLGESIVQRDSHRESATLCMSRWASLKAQTKIIIMFQWSGAIAMMYEFSSSTNSIALHAQVFTSSINSLAWNGKWNVFGIYLLFILVHSLDLINIFSCIPGTWFICNKTK